MANINRIAEHSVDIDLLTSSICIDVGCRGFQFSEQLRFFGCHVVAFDIEDMEVPGGILFFKAGVTNKTGHGFYVDTKDAQAKFLSNAGLPIRLTTLAEIYETAEKSGAELQIDILKLDCEGSEYHILSDPNFQPIPRQITVEFHMHAHRQLHDQYFDKCIENLLKYYIAVKHELTSEHGAGMNYWDSLFVRRDLVC